MTNYLLNEPMSKHTSLRVGGVADIYFMPKNLIDLVKFIKIKQPKNLFWLGLGSNILVRDGGIRGTVIAQSNGLSTLRQVKDNCIYAEAGVNCAKLSRFSQKLNLYGLEFLSGIPGSIGGALAMNAGAFGSDTWSFVKSVTTINLKGELVTRDTKQYDISYRSVYLKNKTEQTWFVGAEFLLPQDKIDLNNDIQSLLKKRNNSQPIGQANCGSVFKNPVGKYAAKLIEASGLKGFCIGKACVSTKHANFIINQGGTSAYDIELLIKHIQKIVFDKFTINLELEIMIVGEAQ